MVEFFLSSFLFTIDERHENLSVGSWVLCNKCFCCTQKDDSIPSFCSALNFSTPWNVSKTFLISFFVFLQWPLMPSWNSQNRENKLQPLEPPSLFPAVYYSCNQLQCLLDSKSLTRSVGANQLSSPEPGLNGLNIACHWFGVIKAIALRSRGFQWPNLY